MSNTITLHKAQLLASTMKTTLKNLPDIASTPPSTSKQSIFQKITTFTLSPDGDSKLNFLSTTNFATREMDSDKKNINSSFSYKIVKYIEINSGLIITQAEHVLVMLVLLIISALVNVVFFIRCLTLHYYQCKNKIEYKSGKYHHYMTKRKSPSCLATCLCLDVEKECKMLNPLPPPNHHQQLWLEQIMPAHNSSGQARYCYVVPGSMSAQQGPAAPSSLCSSDLNQPASAYDSPGTTQTPLLLIPASSPSNGGAVAMRMTGGGHSSGTPVTLTSTGSLRSFNSAGNPQKAPAAQLPHDSSQATPQVFYYPFGAAGGPLMMSRDFEISESCSTAANDALQQHNSEVSSTNGSSASYFYSPQHQQVFQLMQQQQQQPSTPSSIVRGGNFNQANSDRHPFEEPTAIVNAPGGGGQIMLMRLLDTQTHSSESGGSSLFRPVPQVNSHVGAGQSVSCSSSPQQQTGMMAANSVALESSSGCPSPPLPKVITAAPPGNHAGFILMQAAPTRVPIIPQL